MDAYHLPDEYWVVKSLGSCYYVDYNTAKDIRTQLQERVILISFNDLAGCTCYIPPHALTDLFDSTPSIREYERAFVRKMNDEVPSGKDPWE